MNDLRDQEFYDRMYADAEEIEQLRERAERAEQALQRVRELFAGGPDTPCHTTWPDGIECVEVPMADLCRVLDGEVAQ